MTMLLSEAMWRRHANRWSVYTRFAALPAGIAAGWSRVWLGWWAVAPLCLVVVWLVVNPFVFAPVEKPQRWIEKGILGEQLWLEGKSAATHKWRLRALAFAGFAGLAAMITGIAALQLWLALGGAAVVTVAQLARIRRFAAVYDEHNGHASGTG